MERVRHVITINVNRKPCIASPMTSHLTLRGQIQGHSDFEAVTFDLKGQFSQGRSNFEAFYLVKEQS